MHFTRVEHLATIIANGLESDTRAQASGSLKVEVGDLGIKQGRRNRQVPIAPGGVVADHAAFYYAQLSPMMLKIESGRVPTYKDGCDRIIYLVSTLQRFEEAGLTVRVSDRNAATRYASFIDLTGDVDGHVDWDLMKQKWWHNTSEDPERMERRMAECLVHQVVPWTAFLGVVAKTESTASLARAAIAAAGLTTKVAVRPTWYY